MEKKFRGIGIDLLILVLIIGAFGAPLIGPLRENLQDLMGVSRTVFGLGIFIMGLTAGLGGVAVSFFGRDRITRATYLRVGGACMLAGMMLLMLAKPAPGWPVWMLVVGWFLVLFGTVLGGMSNVMIMDIWQDRPATAVILLHGTNAVGKVLAPLLVFLIGSELSINATVFCALLAMMVVRLWSWPPFLLRELADREQDQGTVVTAPALRSWSSPWFWLAAAQFAFIGGSEAGVVCILGSFIEVVRPAPLASLGQAQWAALVLVIMQCGVVAGRFLFVGLSARLGPKVIIGCCLACTGSCLPAVAGASPWVYLPALFLLGITFSAIWPVFFFVAVKRFDRSSFTMAVGLANLIGVNVFILLASVIGNRDAGLPYAILVSTAGMLVFGGFYYLLWPRQHRDADGSQV